METGLREFASPKSLLTYIDTQLTDLRKKLGELLRLIEDLRAKSEQDKKLKSLIMSLVGDEAKVQGSSETVIKLDKLTIMINPSAETELHTLEELAEYINSKIARLQAVRRDIEKLAHADIETKIVAVLYDGVPKSLIIRI
jgi:prefoldin subunit 5